MRKFTAVLTLLVSFSLLIIGSLGMWGRGIQILTIILSVIGIGFFILLYAFYKDAVKL